MNIQSKLFIYAILSIAVIFSGYYFTESVPFNQKIIQLGFTHVVFIFLNNLLIVMTWLILSLCGLSIPFILKFLYEMGVGAKISNIDPSIYYFSSFTHGLGEWLVSFMVIIFTIRHFQNSILFFQKKISFDEYWMFYFRVLKRKLPLITIILLISAVVEVYISNRIILFLT